jgi:hypothetical protein
MAHVLINPYPKPRYIPKVVKHEESLQRQVCTYLRRQYPHVLFRSDYASGLRLTQNQARIHASLQSGKGWPDLFIPYPADHKQKDGSLRHYHGLFIELKTEGTTVYLKNGPNKGKLTTNEHIQVQAATMKQLYNAGYYANFAVGIDEAIKMINWYFQKPQTQHLF